MGSSVSEQLKRFQQEAWERFERLPWPTQKDEPWRRTDPALFQSALTQAQTADSHFEVGYEAPSPHWIQEGVILTDIGTALRQFPQLIEPLLTEEGPEGDPKFVQLHQALWNQGLFCYVPKGVKVDLPLRAWLKTTPTDKPIFPHTLIVIEAGAQATLIDERRGGNGGSERLISNEMVEIFVKEGASLGYVHLQQWDGSVFELFTQRVSLEQEAQFLNVIVALGGSASKASIETTLNGPGARSELLGVLFGSRKQHFDFHTLQDHRAMNTTSDLLYKSALKDQAKAIYTGLIRIRKQAQKSDAYQANRNLLLNSGAKADSIPMLEIEADDVRCTHGVAVGAVDPEQAFYLMSRGLTEEEAAQLIVEGFFNPIFQRLPTEKLKEDLGSEITQRLKEEEKR